ncbi:DUF72 domain-containing protein [Spirulina major CS-329]|uniref:DUF72 domain-containing protein n=1 Tax=Spirulina TaxID=1154 RepID=UPI00232DF0F6|nr:MULTISPECIES: DUF72 domain-containing protein [Spirulina]MDB9496511.1 DUF72 domain-containing protein [Spirulina subsalsa CS-330]MDB9504293.1 DUF72 domain-containing protein [Spirulina major CS-329]
MSQGQNVGQFYLGCAVWAFPGWVGSFYPAKAPAREFLPLYCDRFTAVEGNTTFYAVPDVATLQRWRDTMPPGFKFCPKFPKTVTHQGPLMGQIGGAIAFLNHLKTGLGDRLGPVFAQLPPSYSPAHSDDLAQFFAALPTDHPLGLELRHPDWFTPTGRDRLAPLLDRITPVCLDTRPIYRCPDHPQTQSRNHKPDLPVLPHCPTDTALIRWITHPDPQYNKITRDFWVHHVAQWLTEGKTVYFFVHCPQEEHSPHTARQFYHQLQAIAPHLPPLPWDTLPKPPQQLSLF